MKPLILSQSSYHVNFLPLIIDSGTALKLRGSEILKYGIPDRGLDARLYKNHVLCYDQAKKTPIWVAEHITKADLKGKYSTFHVMKSSMSAYIRKLCNFFKYSNLTNRNMNIEMFMSI